MASSIATSSSDHTKTSLQEKLKLWFKVGTRSSSSSGPRPLLSLSTEQLEMLDSNSSMATRLRVAKELTPLIREQQLNPPGPQLLYMKTRDMLVSRKLMEAQKLVLANFYVNLIQGQYECLDMMRVDLFRLVEKCVESNDESKEEDANCNQMEAPLLILDALSKRGCDVMHVEERLGPLLALMFSKVTNLEAHLEPRSLHILLELLLNAVKYNPGCFETLELIATVDFLANVSCWPEDKKGDEANEQCLQCCFAILGFSYVPLEALPSFVSMLCRMLNSPEHCREAWRVTRSLLETHLGDRALQVLCELLHRSDRNVDSGFVRGAIFCLGTSLWSDKKCVSKFQRYSPMSILPSMAAPLNNNGISAIVIYELALQLKGLSMSTTRRLRGPDLDSSLDVLVRLLSVCSQKGSNIPSELRTAIHRAVDDFLVILNSMVKDEKYAGNMQKFYETINAFSHSRPESLVLESLHYLVERLSPLRSDWMSVITAMMERHYSDDERLIVRLEALDALQSVVLQHMSVYEEELIDVVVVPCLTCAHNESDGQVRIKAVEVLSAVCKACRSKKTLLLLDILDHFLDLQGLSSIKSNSDLSDVQLAVVKLIELFTLKLGSQHNQGLEVAKIFTMLVKLLENCYELPNFYGNSREIRQSVLRFLVSLRGNEASQLGIIDFEDGRSLFSNFVLTTAAPPSFSSSSSSLIVIPIHRATELLVRALRNEREWSIVNFLLTQLPQVFQNKVLRAESPLGGLHSFVPPLVDLIVGSKQLNYPDCLRNSPRSLSRSDFCNKIYPLLAVLASYSDQLESSSHRALITTLNQGLLYRDCCRQCILALTTCALELKRTLYHLIPQVLQNFAKISATKHVAVPMLEFLSTLMRLKDIFSSFNDTQYRSVFALTLPFTNAMKFSSYTVSLAHHVLIMWYLKCRPSYRQNFVHFIIAGLNANAVEARINNNQFRKPVSSTSAAPNRNQNTEDGNNFDDDKMRKRSSSLSDRANGARARVLSRLAVNKGRGGEKAGGLSGLSEERDKMARFHEELIETSVDILSRYMFANVSVRPRSCAQRSLFLNEGNSATWVLGTTIVTVTTSNCDLNANRAKLCDMCHLTCSKIKQSSGGGPSSDDQKARALRLRHQSEFQKKSTSRLDVSLDVDDQEGVQGPFEGSKEDNNSSSNTALESVLESSRSLVEKKRECCACWCTGWAEILVRRPSGDTSWMCRIQNPGLVSDTHATDMNFGDISTLMQPFMCGGSQKQDEDDNGRKVGEEDRREDADDEKEDQVSPLIKEVCNAPPGEKRSKQPEEVQDKVKTREASSETEENTKCRTIREVMEDDNSNGLAKSTTTDPRFLRRTSLQPGGLESPPRLLTLSSCTPLAMNSKPASSGNQGISSSPSTPSPSSRVAHNQQSSSTVGMTFSEQMKPSMHPRDRAHTISGPSPRRNKGISNNISPQKRNGSQESLGTNTERVSGVSPQFVFLQLYLNGSFNNNNCNYDKSEGGHSLEPLLVPQERSVMTSIKILDSIYPHETFKVGLVYHGPGCGQDEALALASSFGSLRYFAFVTSLGQLISLKEETKDYYVGGLRNADGDGDWALVWEDDVMQVVFHCATLMPTNYMGKDPKCNKKKRHVGNDYVVIVYNDDKETNVAFGLISSQVTAVYIIIDPMDNGVNSVRVRCKPELDETLEHLKEPRIVSERNLSVLVRQMALHCNLAAHIHASFGSGREIYASHWLERLRHIKRLRDKVIKCHQGAGNAEGDSEARVAHDFTPLVLRKTKS